MRWAAGAVTALLAFVLAVVIGVASAGAQCGGGGGTINVAAIPADASSGPYDAEQLTNAAHIMNAASAMGLSVRAQQIGVMTAMGEASLRNIGYGDWETSGVTNPDGSRTTSIGLFQQQNSWGSTVDRLNPEKAATLFFERLVKVDGWESLDPSRAAHRVQINSDPNHYTKWWDAAVAVTDQLAREYGSAGAGASTCSTGEAGYPLDQPYNMSSGFGPRKAPTAGASSWHPALDLVGSCDDPIYSAFPGTVVRSDRLFLSIKSADGFVVEYLHSYESDHLVKMGDTVQQGQQIAVVGSAPPSTGCHLDIRINVSENKNPQVAQLARFPEVPGYVDPTAFFQLFGLDICPPEWCRKP
jgi:murein DD-endopeptidase MepM/ murein hydrolase activator NlpD